MFGTSLVFVVLSALETVATSGTESVLVMQQFISVIGLCNHERFSVDEGERTVFEQLLPKFLSFCLLEDVEAMLFGLFSFDDAEVEGTEFEIKGTF